MEQHNRVVATCGCFDIIHAGHIELLRAMRCIGGEVVVFLNSDDSTRRIKGEDRPFMPVEHREAILQSIRYVDSVISFDDDTVINALHLFFERREDINSGNFFWVKHWEYAPTDIPERDCVEQHGGIVLFMGSAKVDNSSALVAKFRGNHENLA